MDLGRQVAGPKHCCQKSEQAPANPDIHSKHSHAHEVLTQQNSLSSWDVCRYEDAMNKVLSQNNVELAVWLCQQLDMGILAQEPLPISQAVLLSLLQQLGYDLSKVGLWLLLAALP